MNARLEDCIFFINAHTTQITLFVKIHFSLRVLNGNAGLVGITYFLRSQWKSKKHFTLWARNSIHLSSKTKKCYAYTHVTLRTSRKPSLYMKRDTFTSLSAFMIKNEMYIYWLVSFWCVLMGMSYMYRVEKGPKYRKMGNEKNKKTKF